MAFFKSTIGFSNPEYENPDNCVHEFIICYYKYLAAEICAGHK